QIILKCDKDELPFVNDNLLPKTFWAGTAYHGAGMDQLAKPLLVKAREQIEASLKARPQQSMTRAVYAMLLAEIGERERANLQISRVLAELPSERDAETRPLVLNWAAYVHATIGMHELALDELEQALELPFGAAAHEEDLMPWLDPLRKYPRYQKLIADHMPAPPAGRSST
ncbi:MAG TPA: hypothetical protein VM074_13140, partial [Solimonas sp.]|nr:hypothetical protein [Solimonas sp.]